MSGKETFQKTLNVSRETLERFQIYHGLLLEWQKRINLIGRGTEDGVWQRHFLDSAQLLPLVRKARGVDEPQTWLDIGAGAGFPGLVLAIMGEQVSLVEPNTKKCAFLRHVSRETSTDIQVFQEKVQDLSPFPVDIVTSRALAPAEQLVAWGRPFLGEGSEFWFLKGETGDQELTLATKNHNMTGEIFPSLTERGGKILRLSR